MQFYEFLVCMVVMIALLLALAVYAFIWVSKQKNNDKGGKDIDYKRHDRH